MEAIEKEKALADLVTLTGETLVALKSLVPEELTDQDFQELTTPVVDVNVYVNALAYLVRR